MAVIIDGKSYDNKADADKAYQEYLQRRSQGGTPLTYDEARRNADWNTGYTRGQQIFETDPRMQSLLKTKEDMAKGYSGEELGAMRGVARGEIAGQRSNYLKSLSSNLARGGVGGARAAAAKGAADQKFATQGADAERKMLIDSAQMARTGQNDLQDFIFRQKYGTTGLALAQQQQGVAERTKAEANKANSGGGGGSWLCTEVHKHSKFTLSEMKTLKKLKLFSLKETPNAIRYFNECDQLVKAMNEAEFDWTLLKNDIQAVIAKFKDCPSCALKRYEVMTFKLIDLFKPELAHETI